MDPIAFFLIFLVITALAGLFFVLTLQPGTTPSSQKAIEGTSFIPSQMFLSPDGNSGLAVNEQSHQICLLGKPSRPPQILPISKLIGSVLVKNGEILGEGKRSQPKEIVQFLRELQRTEESIIRELHPPSPQGTNQRVDLLILIHHEINPIHVVNFLDMDTKEGGILFEKAMGAAKHWHYVLDGLILQADFQKPPLDPSTSTQEQTTTSVASEIEKLSGLMEKNLISQQEFERQKEKLLASKP